VKNSSRRNLLAKLGTGAAAAAALSVAGTSTVARAASSAPKKGATALVNPKSVKTLAVKGKKLEVVVSMNKDAKKGLAVSASPNAKPRIGVRKGALHLGVSVSDRGVSITGLDSVLSHSADGRCVISDNSVALDDGRTKIPEL
jgi:hypothetical protein